MSSANKSFPGVKALDQATFQLRKASIHALLGENGAGKSTLIKIITGVHKQDSGKLIINGKEETLNNPNDATKFGISVVHQERNLIRRFSVGENLMLNNMPKTALGLIDYNEIAIQSKKWLKILDLDIDPNTLVSDLTVAKMQLCEIAKALSLKTKILLLDEPTSSLSPQESKILFSLLKKIVREEGVSIVFVSHKLEEVFNICDDVTVLRDGQNACTSEDIKNLDRQKLVRLMIGRDEQIVKSTRKNQNTKDTILALKNVKTELGHKNINLELNRSEIIGLYGLVGAGRTELMKCLIGQDKITDGEVIINGKKVTINSPKSALEKFKIGYISEDRKKEGLILIHNVLDNTSITVWSQIKKAIGFVSDGMISKKVDPYISQLEVKTPSNYQLISNLSGGNQQKISVAKWLAAGTDILIIDEPTVGIDIKTKAYLHELIIKLADDGTSIILISSDMPEMISLADKIIVMNNFQMNGIVENNHDYDSVSSKIMEYIHT
ncbi:MAG: sugar ABC transporter ATP-binding protein [Tateyamaria sp.]|nr:sugar ABC transporter ATP-binding protein [Tateyamaria sp.]MBT5300770.1 sugar ABC transporter ATP-binding protein [Tateyamaria sp.]MBT6266831.1 sugar ABC transporter ATP-binding protein [Tateyamaria sp.]MBT6342662.1 sugar ABC transporter ATP-binding protein [Tateyamaria sp.]MBT7448531.1 sugar ABC transporter ATP-binding protein [Tateyamaria sp.]